MSELMNIRANHSDFRWRLLASVSALTLIGNIYGLQSADADSDSDHPSIWIELGGQLEQQTGQGDAYSPPFVVNNPDSLAYKPISPIQLEKAPLFSTGLDGKITFETSGTEWIFSAAIRYGRSNGRKDFNQTHRAGQKAHFTVFPVYPPGGPYGGYNGYPQMRTTTQHVTEFANAQVTQRQTHAIVDFTVGKEVGLGMFGGGGVSNLNVGVRFAQFVSRASASIHARPDADFATYCPTYIYPTLHTRFPTAKFCRVGLGFHSNAATIESRRSFHAVGPTVSWNASLPILGNPQAGTLNLDWGANATLLFGRQRASGSHQTSGHYIQSGAVPRFPTQYTKRGNFSRSRAVVIPNVGGFAGASFNFPNAKIALGYRGDFFFGAMDTGVDTRTTKTVGFYGPFATISIGLGG